MKNKSDICNILKNNGIESKTSAIRCVQESAEGPLRGHEYRRLYLHCSIPNNGFFFIHRNPSIPQS